MNELNVILPGVLWHEPADLEYILANTKFPAIDTFLAKGTIKIHDLKYSDFFYHSEFKNGQFSLATNYAVKLGLKPEGNYLLAEPTNLRADRDRLLIAESAILQISDDEASSLILALNHHFAEDNIKFHSIHEELWLVELSFSVKSLETYPILDIVGDNIDDYLPKGDNRIKIHQLINEIQMLFFDVPINTIRQDEGSLQVNSLWFWDKQYKKLPFAMSHILSSNAFVGESLKIDELETQLQTSSVILVDKAQYPSAYRDSFAWVQIIEEIDSKLVARLLKMLKSGKVKKISFWLTLSEVCFQVELRRSDLLKFWCSGDYKSIITRLLSQV